MTITASKAIFEGAVGNAIVADVYGYPDAPLVLLLHGGGQTRHSWRRTGEILGDSGYRAIAYDQRGHGESDWVAPPAYELSDFASDLCAVVQSLAPATPPALVGASLGGLAAMLAVGTGALAHAGAIILADVVHRADPEGAGQLRGFMDADPSGYESIEDAAAAIERHMPYRGGRRNLDGLARNLRRHPDGRYHWHWDPAFLARSRADGKGFGSGSAELVAAIANIAAPLLLARGELSAIVTPELAAEFRAILPAAAYVELSGVGHMVAGDDNAPFTRELLRFLSTHMATDERT